MTMKDWLTHVDNVLKATGEDLLIGSGKVSREKMKHKVDMEYKKYHQKTLSQVEKDYLNEIKAIEQKAKGGSKNE